MTIPTNLDTASMLLDTDFGAWTVTRTSTYIDIKGCTTKNIGKSGNERSLTISDLMNPF